MEKRHLSTIRFVAQAVVLGLALAFVVSLLWPGLTAKRTAPAPAAVPVPAAPSLPVASGPVPREGPASYAAAVERAAPAVVNINTAKVVTVRQHPFFDDPVFREFFGRNFEGLITPRQKVERSLGSGVLMNAQGHILTNHHVIAGADAIQVSFRDGRTAAARVIGTDPDTDLAVLKTDLDNLPPIALGSSEQLRVGDVVLAIGNPFGVGQTVTMGIVSATGRSHLGINVFENFIQTDAAINPGNSGGALIDAAGNLVGINSAIFSRSGGYQGIGFAIPTTIAKSVLDDILRHGRPIRGWVGISGNAVTPEIARHLGLKSTEGVVIVGVVRDGPAHRAGIEPGDLIRAIDGKAINEPREALLAISARKPGSKAKFDLVRNGKSLSLEVPVIERPRQRAGRTE
jgi:Do/DeqQ family serine protease